MFELNEIISEKKQEIRKALRRAKNTFLRILLVFLFHFDSCLSARFRFTQCSLLSNFLWKKLNKQKEHLLNLNDLPNNRFFSMSLSKKTRGEFNKTATKLTTQKTWRNLWNEGFCLLRFNPFIYSFKLFTLGFLRFLVIIVVVISSVSNELQSINEKQLDAKHNFALTLAKKKKTI